MSDQLILAIDQGTSGSKAVVFDTTGAIIAKATAPLQSIYPRPGFVEQNPREIVDSVLRAVGMCIGKLEREHRSAREIVCCGIANQRETFVLWTEDGKPIGNAVVWQCKRPIDICNRLKGSATEELIRTRTGLLVDPYFSGTKAIWLHEQNDQARSAIDAGTALFGTVDTWLLYSLTGGARFLTDYTNACRTLFFNIDTLAWDPELLDSFTLSSLRLAECRHSAAPYGETDFGGRLPRPVPITAMIGDSHASAFGQACFSPGAAKVTMGTGSSILMNTGAKRPHSSSGMVSTICYSTADQVAYALEGIIVSCGSTLTWLRDQLHLYSDISELEKAADRVPDSGGVYLIPGFAGLGAPYWRMDSRGSLQGLTFASTRDHVLRAALESIPYQTADVIHAMVADSGVKLSQLVADGGISQNGFVMQLCADLLDTTVVNRGIEEVSALGAAALAGLGHGIYRSLDDIAALATRPAAYLPEETQEHARAGYAGWQACMAALQ
jgi:glycerol kinase